ncbi:hypothetical protein CEP54_016264, partial [Fusarium duplospermum]
MDLCDTCRNFDIQVFNPTQYPVRGYRAASAFSAAESGCSFCSMLVEASFPEGRKSGLMADFEHWRRWVRIQAEEDNGDIWRFRHDEEVALGSSQPLALTKLWVAQGLSRRKRHIPLRLLADPDSPAALSGDIMGRLVTGATSSEDHMRVLRQWLKDYQANHPECHLTPSGSQTLDAENASLPTRCVEVARGSDGVRSVRVVETAQKHGRYITLSHRWNSGTDKISTTRQNYAERLTGGNFERLPRLIENLFDLAEMLGVPLVWIDSICIIQDNVEDWRKEASKMAQYYQSSLVTVTGFETTTEMGLFTAPERDIPKLARLPYRDRDGIAKGSFYIARAEDHEANAQYTQQVGQSELLTRGWIFQEWLLSRRIVSFTSSGCFYQCQKLKPRNPTGGEVYVFKGERGSANLVFKSKLRLDHLNIPKLVFDQWRLTVHLYSGLALTKAGEDRLIALSGAAKEFSKALGRVGVAESSKDGEKERVTTTTQTGQGDGKADYLWINPVNGIVNAWINNYPNSPTWIDSGEYASGVGTAGNNIRFAKLHLTGSASLVAVDRSTHAIAAWLNGCDNLDTSEKKHRITITHVKAKFSDKQWSVTERPPEGTAPKDHCDETGRYSRGTQYSLDDPDDAKYPTYISEIVKLYGHKSVYTGLPDIVGRL